MHPHNSNHCITTTVTGFSIYPIHGLLCCHPTKKCIICDGTTHSRVKHHQSDVPDICAASLYCRACLLSWRTVIVSFGWCLSLCERFGFPGFEFPNGLLLFFFPPGMRQWRNRRKSICLEGSLWSSNAAGLRLEVQTVPLYKRKHSLWHTALCKC